MVPEETLYASLLNLVERTSTELPGDIQVALQERLAESETGSVEAATLGTMLDNVALARQRHLPICQDTGTLIFFVEAPTGTSRRFFETAAEKAIAEATRRGILRQNCVNSLTGKNTGNNLGVGSPVIFWEEADVLRIKVTLMLKGGGSENMGCQYSLPNRELHAGRDLEGVRKCILDAVFRAQGQGCAPGILGVAIGGDRATGYEESKFQLLRKIGERSPEPVLADLERRVLQEANSLGIGPMGCGGKTTLLDVFIGWRCRLPASYFVSISYMCWCCRRQTIEFDLDWNPLTQSGTKTS
ncbi:MAG: fumarate hydratase [Victivallales bacterium]|nr:fumarate hydratase [Victivallales bacterium]